MKPNQLIGKIRRYSLFAFLLPLIAINLCLLLYTLLGSIESFPIANWNQKISQYSAEEYIQRFNGNAARTFTNCPKYTLTLSARTYDNQKIVSPKKLTHLLENHKVKYIIIEQSNVPSKICVKNYKIGYFLLKNFSSLEKILIKAQKGARSGFASIKNPYLYGEVSISRTARYFPAILIFKPLIILSGIFLILYWKNNLSLFREFKHRNILNDFSNLFFHFGILSSIFLILHASFLGLDIDSKLFSKIRKAIIVSFIFFEILAQIYFTKNLFKFKNKLKNYLSSTILNIKIVFVITIFFVTVVVFALLIFADLNNSTKHMLEWNYFSILLIYYLLSRFLWNSQKNIQT